MSELGRVAYENLTTKTPAAAQAEAPPMAAPLTEAVKAGGGGSKILSLDANLRALF